MDIKKIPGLDPQLPVTLDDLVSEIRDGYAAIIDAFQTITFGDRGPQYPVPALTDGKTNYLLACAHAAYAYAYEGRRPRYRADQSFLDLQYFCRVARAAVETYVSPHGVPKACEKVMAMASLRSRLDQAVLGLASPSAAIDGEAVDFTLQEVAVMAAMHEKSIRNATQKNAPDRLKTKPFGKRTRVSAHDAADWLSRRRSFKCTIPESAP